MSMPKQFPVRRVVWLSEDQAKQLDALAKRKKLKVSPLLRLFVAILIERDKQ